MKNRDLVKDWLKMIKKKKQGLRSNYLSIGKISFASRIKYEKCVCILTN